MVAVSSSDSLHEVKSLISNVITQTLKISVETSLVIAIDSEWILASTLMIFHAGREQERGEDVTIEPELQLGTWKENGCNLS